MNTHCLSINYEYAAVDMSPFYYARPDIDARWIYVQVSRMPGNVLAIDWSYIISLFISYMLNIYFLIFSYWI